MLNNQNTHPSRVLTDLHAFEILQELGQVGDGYQGSGLQSPHTQNEQFVGVTIRKAAQVF